MNIYKLLILGALLTSIVAFSACGNNSDTASSSGSSSSVSVDTTPPSGTLPPVQDINKTNVTVVLPSSSVVLTKNNQVVTIDVRVFDNAYNPYSSGKIVKINPSDVIHGRDIGQFDKTSSTLVNGVATFSYTAPDNLDANKSTLTFGFYHDSDPSKIKVFTMSIVPEVNQTVLTSYELKTSTPNDVNLNLKSTKTFSYSVYNKNGTLLPDTQVKSITVSSGNPALAVLSDNAGQSGTTLATANKNSFTINITSNTKSGLVPLKVDAIFNDENGVEQNLTKVFNVVVLSGPPTAMSLSYSGTTQNAEYAKFIENWVLTVTDKYNNLVNTTPAISMGALVGYAKSSATTSNIANYLYYNATPSDGTLTDATPDTFSSSKSAFTNVDLVNDRLVLFGGEGYRFNAFGKWDISGVTAPNILTLTDDFNGTTVSGLTYAVGHNFRNETCTGDPVVANVYAKDGNNILGTNGSMIIQIEYDYYLVGKSIVLWTNLVGESNSVAEKIGLARKVTLRGNGLDDETYAYGKGFSGIVHFNINISGTVEYYENANFKYQVEVSGEDTNWTIRGDSMSDGNITDCTLNGGVAYVDVNITDPAGSAGTISLKKVLPKTEF